MELRTLKYFVTVAEELNITRAAEILNMSQPPLSAQIKNLEDELGVILFIRGKRRLELTEEGKLLYRRAKEILLLEDKASSEMKSIGKGISGTISVGLVEGMAPDIAAEWFVDFLKEYPNIKFRIVDGNSDELIEKMRGGLISMAIINPPYDSNLLNSFTVGSEKIVAYMHHSNPLAKKEGNLNVNDLVNVPLIVPSRKDTVDTIYKWFSDIKKEPTIIGEMDNYLDAAAFASRNVGVSIFPQTAYVPNPSIILKEIEGGEEKIMKYLFVWLKGRALPTIESKLIDYIKNRLPEKSNFINEK